MPDLWMPGATRLDIGDHQPTDGGPAKAIPHITWDKNATRAKPLPLVPYSNLVDYFGRNPAGMKSAPHILWNPFTGGFTQFVPATSRSKSLADLPGGTRTNRAGSVVIQVEAWFFPWCIGPDGRVYERLVDTPCKGWPELNAWIRSWGVPDRWPMGGPPTSFGSRRNEQVWRTQAGWYAHGDVPENDHTDPGSWPAFVPSGKPPTSPGGQPGTTPEPPRRRRMALASKSVPNVVGDPSATVFSAVPGRAWLNVAADYVPPGEKVRVRVDVSDAYGRFIQTGEIRDMPNGGVGVVELAESDKTRMVSVKRLSHPGAALDATLHYPEG